MGRPIPTAVEVSSPPPAGAAVRSVGTHQELEARLIEACAEARHRRWPVGLARLHVEPGLAVALVEQTVAEALLIADFVAVYGPGEYGAVLRGPDLQRMLAFEERVVAVLRGHGGQAACAVAHDSRGGKGAQRLITAACQGLRRKQGAGVESHSSRLVVVAPDTRALHELARRAAGTQHNVLIAGEAGVGKEILAHNVHRLSRRAHGSFLVVDCAALGGETLTDRQLGDLFEAADGGTLFLDEIDELPPAIERAFVAFLETRRRPGAGPSEPRRLDVRVMASTARGLPRDRADLRRELTAQMTEVLLEIPPLRERRQEIELLARFFLQRACDGGGRAPPAISSEALEALEGYAWPGNIRELRNTMERAHLLCGRDPVTPAHLPLEKMARAPWPLPPAPSAGEATAIAAALTRCHGDESCASELVGLPRDIFRARRDLYGLQ
jgi:DNA-binding NtrC family response regulator